MSEADPYFSVIVPVWNREVEIETSLRSIVDQSFEDFELLVVDDGSTDGTAAVVRSIDDQRIRYLHQDHRGVCAARNLGADEARGRYLAFLDSDDEARSMWLERLAGELDASGAHAVVCGYTGVDPSRRSWVPSLPESWGRVFGGVPGPFVPGTFAIDRAVFDAVGRYDVRLTYSENTELGLRLAAGAEKNGWTFAALDDALVVRYERAARPYGGGRELAARFILEHHADRLELDHRFRGLYHGIAGIGAHRRGQKRDAIAHLLAAVRSNPTRLVHLRRLSQVALGFHGRDPDIETEQQSQSRLRRRSDGDMHGVLVTFRRPELLRTMLETLTAPKFELTSLVVVDNDPERSGERTVSDYSDRLPICYVAAGDNSGPAGGIAMGMERLLPSVDDDDWIIVLDDDDPPTEDIDFRALRSFALWLADRGAPVGVVGPVGARLDRRKARFTRIPDRELRGPISVDCVSGGHIPLISVRAIRAAGVFRHELFFGFDDLDFGLRIQRAGFAVIADGDAWLRARIRSGRVGANVPAPERAEAAWRRYYSVRNLIVVLRREIGLRAAVAATVANVALRAVADIRKRPRVALLFARAGTRGALDAWQGKLGRRIEPVDTDS